MSQSNFQIKTPLRFNKNFVFKGKKYPVDFNIIIKYSNYFYKNQSDFENMETIDFSIFPDISEEAFENFILCCQNNNFTINNSIIFSLYQLSIQYEVIELLNITQNYIKTNHRDLVFNSISFKNQLKNEDIQLTQEMELIGGPQIEEEIISSHFFEYTNDIQLTKLPVPILLRIIKRLNFDFDSMDEEIQTNLFNFLFKSLDEHSKEASILFTDIDFTKVKIDAFSRLLNDYSEKFDFNVIGIKMLITMNTKQAKELNQLKEKLANERTMHKQKEDHLNNELKQREQQIKNECKQHEDQVRNQLNNEHKKREEQIINESKQREQQIKNECKQHEDQIRNQLNNEHKKREEQIINESKQREQQIRNQLNNEINKLNEKVTNLSQSFFIILRTIDGKKIYQRVSPNEKIGDFKKRFGQIGNIIFDKKVLNDNSTFKDYNVHEGSTMLFVRKILAPDD